MKVIMIEPKSPGKHVFSTVNMPRLGLPILGTLLKNAGHQVELIMGSRRDISLSHISNADLVAISTTTSTVVEAYHLADFARSQGKPVIMGGAHVTFLADEALEHCDYVCRGEADLTFMDLVDCIEQGKSLSDIPGVSYRGEDGIVHNPRPDWVDINRVPFPDLSLFKGLKMSTYPVATSRGCPFDCTFCSVTSMFGRKYRCLETESVLEELVPYKGKKVFFIDDNFTANPRRSKELMQQMIERNIRPSWWCAQVRTDAARDEELLKLMRDSGCRTVFVGLESINPKTLQSFNKKQDVEDIEFCIKRFHDFGIMVHGMFVFGADNDTVETIEDTLAFARRNRIDTVQFMILTPLPGSRTFDELAEADRLLSRDWNLYDAHHVVFQPALMTPYELQTATISAFKRFYTFGSILQNIRITGFQSVAFRAVGYWLSRRWDQDNRWYYKYLQNISRADVLPGWRKSLSKSIGTFKLRKLKYLSSEKLIDIEMTEQEGTFIVNLKGYLNDFALSETFKTLYCNVPGWYQNIRINIEELTFSSDKIMLKFIRKLDQLAGKARSVEIKPALSNNRLLSVLKKYDLKLPGFSI
ncbi:MAG: radical SAM protein [Syntrophomonadaceae bacterium]|nr:radical SAM protein [Syntrophomonadaceae bacterium]